MPSWCFAHFLLKQTSEVARTHGRAACETVDREVAPDVIRKPGKQVAKRAVLTGLCCKSRAELRLAASAPQKYDHDLCNFEGNRSAQIFFHQRKCKIDTGCDSCRCVTVAVLDIDGVPVDSDQRVVSRELVAPVPVSGRAPAIEQSSGSQHKSARTNRTEAPAPSTVFSKPVQKILLKPHLLTTVKPGNQQCIDWAVAFSIRLISIQRRAHVT